MVHVTHQSNDNGLQLVNLVDIEFHFLIALIDSI